jgi:hypothetical protein
MHYWWKPNAKEMAEKIKIHIREKGEDAVGDILNTVADTLLEIDYPIPIEDTFSMRKTCKSLIETASDWLRNAWRSK